MELDLGERERFEAWYLSRRETVVGIAFLYVGSVEEAQDLTQEVFARAWQHWDVVSGHPNPDAWSRTVLHNLVVARWRRSRLERSRFLVVSAGSEGPNADHLDLARLLTRLPPNQRRALILREVLDLSVDDTAAEMGAPAGTVRSWVHRARAALADQAPHGTPAARKED